MKDLFNRNLLRIREVQKPQTFAQALFGAVDWGHEIPKVPFQKEDIQASAFEFSEKVQVIESLERFAKEKFEEEKKTILKIPGGEIELKKDPTWDDVKTFSSFADLKNNLSLDQQTLEICLASKSSSQVKVMFVSESFRNYDDYAQELKDSFLNQLLPAFPLKTAEFFSRMIAAMKLVESEIIIYPTALGDKDLTNEALSVAAFYRPEVILTLGANPSHKILKIQDRLSQIHGQFFHRKLSDETNFLVVPLFHPSIIETNQNMKKTAWMDMQKIMKQLKKL
jgi:hypothetical protein